MVQPNQVIIDFVRLNLLEAKNRIAVMPSFLKGEDQGEFCHYPAESKPRPKISLEIPVVGQSVPLKKKHGYFSLPTWKLGGNLKHLPAEKPGIVLVLGGSFNPVHRMHVQLFECARRHLRNMHGEDRVVGGFLSPSADDYVRQKLGANAMKFRHRTNACSLGVEKSPWIDVCDWGLVAVNQVCKNMSEILRNEFPGRQFQIIEICGADYALKYKLKENDFDVLCCARNGATAKLKKRLANTHSNVDVIDEELEDISSTEIRKKICSGAIADLTERKFLPNGVLEYTMGAGDSLFY